MPIAASGLCHNSLAGTHPGAPWTGRGLDAVRATYDIRDLALVAAHVNPAYRVGRRVPGAPAWKGEHPMRIVRAKDYQDMSRKAANIISAQVILNPEAKLGLATGTTPIGAYDQLARWNAKGDCDFAHVQTFNLDEYRGLSHDDPQSYHYFMRDKFFNHINIDLANTHVPDGSNLDADAACAEYDALVKGVGYVDLQLLGIGNNGHIGFNEPDDHFSKGTHCVNLTESTIKANSRLFEREEDVPRQAYTMGVQTIMMARSILVVANGPKKAQAVYDMIYGPVTPSCPASILQLHTNCTVVADEEALALCPQE